MKKLILAVILVFLLSIPAFSFNDSLSPAEDTFVDSLYQNDVMGESHSTRLWAGPVINMEAAKEYLAGHIETDIISLA